MTALNYSRGHIVRSFNNFLYNKLSMINVLSISAPKKTKEKRKEKNTESKEAVVGGGGALCVI